MPFTSDDAAAAAEQLTAQHQAVFEILMQWEDHLGRRLLAGATLTGITRRRRAEVQAGLATLWRCYELYRAAAVRVREIHARRSPLTVADLREIEELATGTTTVALPDPNGSAQPLLKQVTLDELVTQMHAIAAMVHTVVTATDRVWAELGPRIDRCHQLLRDTEALAADLGLAIGTDPAVALLPRLTSQLERVRRIALTDPLRLWADGAVEVGEAEQLTARCEQVHAELNELAELRRYAQLRLDQIAAELTETIRLGEQICAERHRAARKIRGVPAPDRAAAPSTHPLAQHLAAARQLYQHACWRRLTTELPTLERAATAALMQARAELQEAGRPLRDRAELRGRLGAYRAKAAAMGRIEDLALEQLYQQARDLLWSAPCDLTAAAAAVTDYQHAVNNGTGNRTGNGAGGGGPRHG